MKFSCGPFGYLHSPKTGTSLQVVVSHVLTLWFIPNPTWIWTSSLEFVFRSSLEGVMVHPFAFYFSSSVLIGLFPCCYHYGSLSENVSWRGSIGNVGVKRSRCFAFDKWKLSLILSLLMFVKKFQFWSLKNLGIALIIMIHKLFVMGWNVFQTVSRPRYI